MRIRDREYDLQSSYTYIMGILNVTPDSFSDGGSFCELDMALNHVEDMLRAGADIIDIGGESTRPGHSVISVQEEIDRVCNVISLVRDHYDVPISIDTYKAQVAEAAISAGADMINDIWGLRYEEYHSGIGEDTTSRMAEVAAGTGVPVLIMHNDCLGRDISVRDGGVMTEYIRINGDEELRSHIYEENVVDRVIYGLGRSIEVAEKASISRDKLIIDPGVGFAKTQRENLMVTNNLERIISEVGIPMLLAASRKSMIGNVLELDTDQREEGTIVTTILAAEAGCSFVRVHDVERNSRALKMLRTIKNSDK